MDTCVKIFLLGILLPTLCLADDWPCPVAADIAPCVCSVGEDSKLILECSEVNSDEELAQIFTKPFPFTNLKKFNLTRTVDNNSELKELPSGLFGPITFEEIYIKNSDLSSIDDNIFNHMNITLKRIEITGTNLDIFYFDNVEILTKLTTLILYSNKIKTMSNLQSNTLRYLDLNKNVDLFFSGKEFIGVPRLTTLRLNNIGLTHIAPDLFVAQGTMNYIDLSYNKLEYIQTDVFHFEEGIAKNINLKNNNIALIDKDTFSGLHEDIIINLENNQLDDLPEDVWLPVFEVAITGNKTAQINFKNNPLQCGCNLKWLITDPEYKDEINQGTTCNDGTLLIDIDEDFIDVNCP